MTAHQSAAFTMLRALAPPSRYRVRQDVEGYGIIPGKLGRVEFHCDENDCHGCPEKGPFLGVYTDRPRLFAKLWAIPGVRQWQTGDREMRARRERSHQSRAGIRPVDGISGADLDRIFTDVRGHDPDALLVMPLHAKFSDWRRIADFAVKSRLPASGGTPGLPRLDSSWRASRTMATAFPVSACS